MKAIGHPSEYIKEELVNIIRYHSAEAELLKQLHPAQLSIIYEQKWFQLFVPQTYNGLELSLPDALLLEEVLAWTDGSIGWTITLCAGAGWFIGFLTPEIAAAVFNDPAVCLAGSGRSSGIAKKITGGYEVTGLWSHATGAAHATAFTANCLIEENGVIVNNEEGTPVILSFLFLRNEVTIHHNWSSIGMKATGSNSFEVHEIIIPENRCFRINSNNASLPHPIYQYPFIPFAELTLAVNSSGMAIRFLDLCKILFTERGNHIMLSRIAMAMEQLAACRNQFYQVAEISWQHCLNKDSFTSALLTSISDCSRNLAATARRLVNELYPYCGLYASNPETEINRVWRNLHTASQHSLLNR
jgi:hypothetical protein